MLRAGRRSTRAIQRRLDQGQIVQIQSNCSNTDDPAQRSKLLDDLTQEEEQFGYVSDMLNPVQRHVETHPSVLRLPRESILPDESVLEYVLAELRPIVLLSRAITR